MAIYEDRTVARGAQNIGSIIKMWGVSQHLGRKRQATEAVLGAVMEDDPEQLRTAVGTALQFGSAGIEALNETAFPLYEMMNRQKRNNAYIQNQQRQSEQRRFRDTTNAYGETVSALESEMKRFVDPLKNKIDEEAASKDSQIIKLRGARDVFLNGMLAPSAEVLNGGGGGLTGGEQSVVPREVGVDKTDTQSIQPTDQASPGSPQRFSGMPSSADLISSPLPRTTVENVLVQTSDGRQFSVPADKLAEAEKTYGVTGPSAELQYEGGATPLPVYPGNVDRPPISEGLPVYSGSEDRSNLPPVQAAPKEIDSSIKNALKAYKRSPGKLNTIKSMLQRTYGDEALKKFEEGLK